MRLIGPQPLSPAEDEELHPDLVAALVGKGRNRSLVHPYYCGSYEPGFNYRHNADYEKWRQARQREFEARDWQTFIGSHHEEFWLQALESVRQVASDQEWADAARYAWYLSNTFWNRQEDWRAVLEYVVAGPGWMTDHEKAKLQQQQNPLTIFRGCRNDTVQGFSWSLDPDKAQLHARPARGRGILVRGTVDRANVIALLDRDEDEEEIVVFPENVADIETL